MGAFEESKNDMNIWTFISQSFATIFLDGFSASSHLIFLLLLSISWAFKSRTVSTLQNSKQMLKNTYFLYYWLVLISCLGLAFGDLLLCILNYLSGYRHGWSNLKFVSQLDFSSRTLTWFVISAYLHIQFSHSSEHMFPVLLKIWWLFYFLMSCSYLVIRLSLYWHHSPLPLQLWVTNSVSCIVGLFFCYVGSFCKDQEDEDFHFLEPLLKIHSNRSNGDDEQGSNVSRESVTPYENASLLSIFTFTWMEPLLALGYKKTLDLEDIPQLADYDSANVIFTRFRNEIEYNCNGNGHFGKISILKLVKILILSSWKEILWTGLLSMMANRVRVALLAIIYKKSLRLSSQSTQHHTSGEDINLITVDVERTGFFSWYLHDIWRVPLQVVLALLILYKRFGLASLVAFVTTMILMLANFPLGKLLEKFQRKMMESKDQRMKVTSEALRNIKILKLQGWEMKFLAKIFEFRNLEIVWLKKLLYTSAINGFVYLSAPMFVSMVTFGFCALMGIPLESGNILSALATFEILQGPIYNLPDTISMVVQTKVSLNRISSFLCLDDLHLNVIQTLSSDCTEVAVEIIKGNFSWDLHSPNLTLKDLNFRVYHGMKVAICGSVGSGKSSLLSCILGEMSKVSGVIKLNGKKAYVARTPWIQSGKIVDNILFGKKMDDDRYKMILEACSLKKDLEFLAFGDQTIIGDSGVNLSGGQKQRIQLARALYHDADIYLLDDPFSAVDAHTGTYLFKECLLGLLGSKTVVYVTHQIEFLPSADLILVMRDGKITQVGKYEEIISSGTDFMDLVGSHKKALAELNYVESGSALDKLGNKKEDDSNICSEKFIQDDEEREPKNYKIENQVGPERPKGQLVQEEKRKKGGVSLSFYWKYVTIAYKGAFVPLILLAEILFQLLQIISSYWMVLITPISEDAKHHVKESTIIFIYIILTIGSSLCILIRSMLIVNAGYKTSSLLFNKMHLCIFRASLPFFDSTPSGRILNRASRDQSAIDISIPHQFEELLISIIRLLRTIAVMSQVSWKMLIVFIPMSVACIWYQQYYTSTARELSRLVGVCQAPITQHFSESRLGLTTIRCFNQEERFMDTNLKLVDGYFRPIFHLYGAMEWLCFRMDMLASITYVLSLVSLILMLNGVLKPGVMGLAVTYGLGFSMHGVIWDLSSLENKIISVERILQYTCIPNESPLLVEEDKPDHEWPSHGKVDIVNLQVRYAPHLPIVLRGLTCTFLGGKKIGIVGRTGSGKSTLVQALFRTLEPITGHICIDGINISRIGLHNLRSRLSIIPQEPTMFEGTLRSNLDPLEEYTDEKIWEALDKCQLGDEVRKKDGKLDFTATASVDTNTDNQIQQTLRQHFSGSTILIIAHRITSILDVDMVLLLDNGLIMEYDSPTNLLENKSSLFSKLVKEYTRRCSS
ncbi:ABC transporter C family member 3-like [Macadamia integrifolia]|uniref:ABC transporter C family member 3-like n=1 Tax=Macadamia integrifolia TaxID=60698 RepID=UPI001C4E9E97|nr:ABC transporter C family member 3-like [Macadamia integrifolia]